MKTKLLSLLLFFSLVFTLPVAAQSPALTVTADASAKSGAPGAVVIYTLTLTNTGSAALNLTAPDPDSLNGWPASVTLNSTTLNPGESTTAVVSVAIPASASDGNMDVTTVRFLDGSTEVGRIGLTTTARRPQPTAAGRPLLVLDSYGVSGDQEITPGQEFELRLTLINRGQDFARNVLITFTGSDFLPVDTGGVRALNEVDPNEKVNVFQPLIANPALSGQSVATLTVNLTYTNLDGSASFTEALTITINLKRPSAGGPARPTATPTLISRPQLVVTAYQTDVDPLQPGAIFELKLDIRNLGTANARSVTMVLGGGASLNEQGTPVPGGSELSTFAPLGASNLIFLGDVPVGETISATQKLIVNVTANPGAYPFKLSFIYDDEKGSRQVNDQVITLLIYQLPQVEVGFYRDPGIFYTNQMSMLPLQVTNLGRKTAVLGNMRVTSPNADITNNVTLVGSLEPGGYFTLDANIMPFQPGPLDIEVSINYTDDFNQPRTITQTLTVEVMDMPTPEFPTDGFPPEPPPAAEETFWQKVLRFLRGLIGLDSAEPTPAPILPGEQPPFEEEVPGQPIPVPVEPLPRPKG
jgi:hypothetical protein